MRKLLPIFLIIMYSFNCLAQLKVDAGNDIFLCWPHDFTTNEVKLGGCPVATGGVEPYTYTWSGIENKPLGSRYWIFASEILDDTTKSNPSLKRYPSTDGMILYLKIQDAENNVKYDSIMIKGSEYTIYTVGARKAEIKKGDSVRFYGNPYFDCNLLPLTFVITPSEGLTDPTNIYGWAKPDTSTAYYLQATNPIGCKSEKLFYLYIEVDTLNVSVNNQVYNNPCIIKNGSLTLPAKYSDFPYILNITNINGQNIFSDKVWDSDILLDALIPKVNSMYIVSIGKNNHFESFKLFIR